MLDVDEYGLDEMDGRVLHTLIEKFEGGPVGFGTPAVAMGEDASTLEEVYPPAADAVGGQSSLFE